MRIVVTGSRSINDYALFTEVMKSSGYHVTALAHGDCELGVDQLAELWAIDHGITPVHFPITSEEWARYGGYAGPRRNGIMLKTFRPEAVVGLWDGVSTGTKNCVEQARVMLTPVYLRRTSVGFGVSSNLDVFKERKVGL